MERIFKRVLYWISLSIRVLWDFTGFEIPLIALYNKRALHYAGKNLNPITMKMGVVECLKD